MTESKEWKNKFLSSGFPLEFEVAKVLVSKGFCIDSDYTYSRRDSGLAKDFSVDIKAMATSPFTNPNKISTQLELLVECKYRNSRNVKWFFLPDINKPDFSPITLGYFMRIFDNFSAYKFTKTPVLKSLQENVNTPIKLPK